MAERQRPWAALAIPPLLGLSACTPPVEGTAVVDDKTHQVEPSAWRTGK